MNYIPDQLRPLLDSVGNPVLNELGNQMYYALAGNDPLASWEKWGICQKCNATFRLTEMRKIFGKYFCDTYGCAEEELDKRRKTK